MSRWSAIVAFTLSLYLLGSVAGARPAGLEQYPPVVKDGDQSEATVVVVAPGDHLWSISEEALARRLGRDAGIDEIDPFWRDVIETNIGSLRSGNPDLIYPGEEIALPDD